MANRKTDTCTCGNPKTPVSEVCQSCHMKRIHRRRKLKSAAHTWAERYKAGRSLYLEAGEGMDESQFATAIRDVVSSLT